MGNFYVNFSVKHDDPQRVADALKRAGHKAFITPLINGYVVVSEEESDRQDTSAIERVGALLSREADAPVLAVLNHDDDVLCYWLFVGGRIGDSYNSDPGYHGDPEAANPAAGGDAQRLCEVLSVPFDAERFETILRGDFGMAIDRHMELIGALGLPDCAVGFGYSYVEQGECPDDFDADQIIHVS